MSVAVFLKERLCQHEAFALVKVSTIHHSPFRDNSIQPPNSQPPTPNRSENNFHQHWRRIWRYARGVAGDGT